MQYVLRKEISNTYNENFIVMDIESKDIWVAKLSRSLDEKNVFFTDLNDRAILANRLGFILNIPMPEYRMVNVSNISNLNVNSFSNLISHTVWLSRYAGITLKDYLAENNNKIGSLKNIDSLLDNIGFNVWIGNYDRKDVDILVDREDRKSIRVKGKSRILPDFVIPRTGSGTTYYIKAIIRHLERIGVILINGSYAIDNVKDKLYSQQILGQSNLPVPKTMLVKHPIDVDFIQKSIGFPCIIKTLSGSFGAGVFMADNKTQLKQLLKMAEITNENYDIIIQEYVKDSYGKDLRVLVINGKVVGCMMRQSVDDDFRANITRGGEGIPYQITEDIEWIAGESSRLLDLDIAGVDLLFDNGGYKICEVNSSPGFEGMDKYCKTNIAEQIVTYVKYKIG
mgnify:CR=1 FL=1